MVGVRHILVLMISLSVVSIGLLLGLKNGAPLVGVGLAIAAILLLAIGYLGVAYALYRWQPPFPPCKAGKCVRYEDYEYLEERDGGRLYRCRCGLQYLMTDDGYFMQLTADGRTVPFMRHSRFGRWQQCREDASGSA